MTYNVFSGMLTLTRLQPPHSCRRVVLRGCGKLQGEISCFLPTRSSQMNVRMVSSIQVRVRHVWLGIVYVCALICMYFVQEHDVARLWEVARCSFLLSCN